MPIVTDEAVIRVRGQVDPSLQGSAAAAGSAYQRLAADVRQASADFNAGIISIEDYKVAMESARAEAISLRSAGVAPAGRDVAAFNTVLRTTQSSAAAARQGIGTIRSSLATLTATAIGARGTFGTLGGAILQFAAGNTIAVGVVAGIAAMALAWRKLTERTREAREELEKYRKEGAGKFGPEILGPVFQGEQRVAALRRDQADIRARLAVAQAGETFTDVRQGITRQLPPDQAAIDRITRELRDNNRALIVAEKELAEARRKTTDETLKERDAWIAARMPAAFNIQSIRAPLATGLRFTAPQYVTQNAIGAGGGGDDLSFANKVIGDLRQKEFELTETRRQLNVLLDAGTITQDEYAAALGGVEGATKRASIATERFAVAAINTAAAMIAQIAGGGGGGGVGGFLQLAGGLISFINPIAGAAVAGVGAIISATTRNDPVPVKLADVSETAARKMRDAGPDNITLYVVDSRGNLLGTREVLKRAERRDAIQRVA